jgi:hypothetical protein
MQSINLKITDIKGLAGKLTKNLGRLFFIVFLLLLLLEVFEINTSLQIFLSSNQNTPLPPSPDKGVRIDFVEYDAVIKRIQEGENFIPTDGVTSNPFSSSH